MDNHNFGRSSVVSLWSNRCRTRTWIRSANVKGLRTLRRKRRAARRRTSPESSSVIRVLASSRQSCTTNSMMFIALHHRAAHWSRKGGKNWIAASNEQTKTGSCRYLFKRLSSRTAPTGMASMRVMLSTLLFPVKNQEWPFLVGVKELLAEKSPSAVAILLSFTG